MDEAEERKHIAQVEHLGIRQAAREANSPEMPNMEIIGEMLSQQRQSATAMAQHVRDMAEQTRREAAGMAAEHSAELQRLANGQAEAANRQRMAESVLTGLRDTALEQRNHIADLASKAGRVTNNIDQRHFETHNHNQTTTNTQMTDVNVHNQVMNMMQSHAQQFGRYMEQHRINEEQMRRIVYETVLHQMQQQHQQQAQIPPQVILHMVPPPQPPMIAMMRFHPPGPPPPPPGAGAIALPVLVPKPAPTIKPPAIIRQQQRQRSSSRDPYDKARKS